MDGLRDLRILAADDTLAALHDGYLRAEAAIHLRIFQPDIAAADDHQMVRHPVQPDDVAVGHVGDVVDALEIGNGGARADIEKDLRCRQQLVADPDRVSALKARMAADQRAVGHLLQPAFVAAAAVHRHFQRPPHHSRHVDRHVAADADAVIGAAAREMRRIGAGHQRLGRLAAGVDAGAAHMLALDDGDGLARVVEASGKRWPGLAGADDDRVECLHDAQISVRRPAFPAKAG